MNAGRDYARARAHAQANADASGTSRWIHMYNNTWWIDKSNPKDAQPPAEEIKPKAAVQR